MQGFEPGVPTAIDGCKIPVQRILGRNPGPMTGPGTNSYLIGQDRLCLLDPGPIDEVQFESFMSAIGNRKLEYLLLTHTHGDHSPGAARIHEATDATLVGISAPNVAGQDQSFQPKQKWQHGDEVDCGEYTIRLIHTPGHVSNHLCFLLVEEALLFTGDHVLQGTTSVILPPDGDMGSYLDSLSYLQTLRLRYLAPGHGGIMDEPQLEIEKLIAHRLKREAKVLAGLAELGECTVDELVLIVYDDVAEHLIPWAKRTMLAHLIKLQRDDRIVESQDRWRLL